MFITLYKNCILTNSYSEVFDVHHKDENGLTAHERYLNTLTHVTMDVGEVYYTNNAKISFELLPTFANTNFYEFNYIKFVDENINLVRYCFIENISVVNSIAVVNYVEDMWANYASTMKMRKSLLTRSRIIDYGNWELPFYALGMDYQGNNNLDIVPLDTQTGEVNVVMQFQAYKTTAQGELSDRSVINVILGKSDGTITYDLVRAESIIQQLYTSQSTKKVRVNGSQDEYNYELYNILFLPSSLNLIDTDIYTQGSYIEFVDTSMSEYRFYPVIPAISERVIKKTYTIPADFKTIKIGTFTTPNDLVQNGTDVVVNVSRRAGYFDFLVYLEFQNQVIEITDNFRVNIPISVQSADVTQQQATARELNVFNSKLGIARGAMSIGGGVMNIGAGTAQIGIGASTGHAGQAINGLGAVSKGFGGIASGIMNIISSNKNLEVANREMYTTNKGVQAVNNGLINSYYGLVLFKINPDNEIEVKANIDNAGYVCNEIVDNILETITTGKTNKWNVMQFEYVNIYGSFTQIIANTLRDILYGGFKIWYDETAIEE